MMTVGESAEEIYKDENLTRKWGGVGFFKTEKTEGKSNRGV